MNRICRGLEQVGLATGVTRQFPPPLNDPGIPVGLRWECRIALRYSDLRGLASSPAMKHLFDRRGQCGIGVMIFGKNPKLDDLRR